MKSPLNKFVMLTALLGMFGMKSSKQFKASEVGKKKSLARYTENNFSNLPLKRKKGKWVVCR